MNHDLLTFALVKLLVFLPLLIINCAGHHGNDLAASVFINVHIVSKTAAEVSLPINTFMELYSNANLPRLVNLALILLKYATISSYSSLWSYLQVTDEDEGERSDVLQHQHASGVGELDFSGGPLLHTHHLSPVLLLKH